MKGAGAPRADHKALLIIAATVGLLLPSGADATTTTVRNTHNAGPGSLRRAVAHAGRGDEIDVPPGSYELRRAIKVEAKLSIRGAGPDRTSVIAVRRHRIFSMLGHRRIEVSGLKMTGGRSPKGGAIFNAALLRLENVALIDNRATGAGAGGAILNIGTLTVRNSRLERNEATHGGAIGAGLGTPSQTGPVRVIDSTLRSNRARLGGVGGAIDIEPTFQAGGESLTVVRSTIEKNEAVGGRVKKEAHGGGIAFEPLGKTIGPFTITIRRSTISNNRVVADHAFGGGLYVDFYAGGPASIRPLTIANSTVSDNRVLGVDAAGGGIFDFGVAYESGSAPKTLTNVTLASNAAPEGTGGGIWFSADSEPGELPLFSNSIVAENSATHDSDCSSQVTSAGHNLESESSCGFTAEGDLQDTAPGLRPLGNNGGPTPTRAPLRTSPAVDAAGATSCLATDQRGVTRPQGPACDIGAFELRQP